MRIRIYTNDHNPPHIHAVSPGGTAKIAIGNVNVRPSILEVDGMARRDVARALRIVGECQEQFLKQWEGIHGKVGMDRRLD